ncbi:MAG: DUF3108 domain-containing protein [Ignavibacteria bacterium]|nr:DUF3108 domain-containing protein [Ignavibacteria bacterium]
MFLQIISILVVNLFLTTSDVKEPVKNKVLYLNEDLLNEVKYTFIKLGTIRIKTINKITVGGKQVFETKAFIDSYEGLPIVDLHSIYNSQVTENFYSEQFIGLDKHKVGWRFTKYDFDYNKKNIFVQKGFRDGWKVDFEGNFKLNEKLQDGLSLFFFARNFCRNNLTYDIPTFLNEETTLTTINFYNQSNEIKIDAVDYPIDCVRIDGQARFTGIFGLTGFFEGYFTNDEACVPIKATMKVIIGNINVELKEWKRGTWNPPRKI